MNAMVIVTKRDHDFPGQCDFVLCVENHVHLKCECGDRGFKNWEVLGPCDCGEHSWELPKEATEIVQKFLDSGGKTRSRAFTPSW